MFHKSFANSCCFCCYKNNKLRKFLIKKELIPVYNFLDTFWKLSCQHIFSKKDVKNPRGLNPAYILISTTLYYSLVDFSKDN